MLYKLKEKYNTEIETEQARIKMIEPISDGILLKRSKEPRKKESVGNSIQKQTTERLYNDRRSPIRGPSRSPTIRKSSKGPKTSKTSWV